MYKYQEKRVAARKKLLNREDIIRFDEVPGFIIDSFFGSCTYKKRLIAGTFGYVNGISIEQLLVLCRWNDTKKVEVVKMKNLYTMFEATRDQPKYYSYNVHEKLVIFLNGDVRKFGKHVPKNA